ADALCDLQYVLSGTVLEFGFRKVFDALFAEVHRSNMSKACSTEEEANQTVVAQMENAFWEKSGDKYLIYRSSDRKTLKSINYSPANLKSIINGISDQSS